MTPYPAQPSSDGLGQHITRLLVATAVPVFGLFVLRLILASLPMIKNAGPIADLGITPLLVVSGALDTVIYFLILRLCLGVSQQMKARRPQWSELASITLLAGIALVATLAYSGYESLMGALAPTQMELYNWLFLAVVLTPVAVIVVIVTRRLDFFSNLLFGKLNEAVARPSAFAPATAAWHAGPPAGMPPSAADPAHQQMADRLQAIQRNVSTAAEAAQRLRAQGKLSPELVESSTKMHQYLTGAQQSVDNRDLASAKGFADWADYEANRLLQAAR